MYNIYIEKGRRIPKGHLKHMPVRQRESENVIAKNKKRQKTKTKKTTLHIKQMNK